VLVTLLPNCRADGALWSRETARLVALVHNDAAVRDALGRAAGLDALTDTLLALCVLRSRLFHRAGTDNWGGWAGCGDGRVNVAGGGEAGANAAAAPPPPLGLGGLDGADPAAMPSALAAPPAGSMSPLAGGAQSGVAPVAAKSGAAPVAAKSDRMRFARELSESLLITPWSSKAPPTPPSPGGAGGRVGRWLPEPLAPTTWAGVVVTLLRELVRAAVRANNSDVLERLVGCVGGLEAGGLARPLVLAYVSALCAPALASVTDLGPLWRVGRLQRSFYREALSDIVRRPRAQLQSYAQASFLARIAALVTAFLVSTDDRGDATSASGADGAASGGEGPSWSSEPLLLVGAAFPVITTTTTGGADDALAPPAVADMVAAAPRAAPGEALPPAASMEDMSLGPAASATTTEAAPADPTPAPAAAEVVDNVSVGAGTTVAEPAEPAATATGTTTLASGETSPVVLRQQRMMAQAALATPAPPTASPVLAGVPSPAATAAAAAVPGSAGSSPSPSRPAMGARASTFSTAVSSLASLVRSSMSRDPAEAATGWRAKRERAARAAASTAGAVTSRLGSVPVPGPLATTGLGGRDAEGGGGGGDDEVQFACNAFRVVLRTYLCNARVGGGRRLGSKERGFV
jgi:hypothetical protein